MKRDEDLCFKILQFIEKKQTSYEQYMSDNIKIKGYTADQIVYHIDLLGDEDFIEIENVSTTNNNWRAIKRITNVGHDFLDDVRDG